MTQKEVITVKRIPFYLFLILLGFISCYVFDFVKNNFVKKTTDTVRTSAHKISREDARKYMTTYIRTIKKMEPMNQLVTEKGEILRGFWLSKETLKSIDESVKGETVGYSIYFGILKSDPKGQVLNLVVRGNKAAPPSKLLTAHNTSAIEDEGDYYDSVDPCPSQCGEEVPE